VHWSSVGDLRSGRPTRRLWAGRATVATSCSPASLTSPPCWPHQKQSELESGAIVTIDEIAARVRILPIRVEPGIEGS